MSRIIQFEGRSIEVPDDATDDEVASILESTSTPVAQPAPAEPSFFEKLGSGMNQVRDFMTNLSAPKQESVLQGQAMPDPQLDPALNEQAMLRSRSPDSVMFTAGRGKQQADRMTAQGKKIQELAQKGGYSSVPEMFDAVKESESRKQFAKENPNIAAVGSGAANMLRGGINAPGAAAGFFNKTVVDPVLGALGAGPMPAVPVAPGSESLQGIASDYMPKVAKIPMGKAWDDGLFGQWLAANVSAQLPQMPGQILGAVNPVARAAVLPAMGGQAAGNSYADGDDPRVAVAKGVVEVLSEGASFGAADKIKDLLTALPAKAQKSLFTNIATKAAAAGGAVTGQMLAGAIEETVAQVGNNALDIYASGKNKSIGDGVADSAVVGAFASAGMSAPNVATAMQDNSPKAQAARELAALLRGGQFASTQAEQSAQTPSAEQLASAKGFLVPEAPKVEDQPTAPVVPAIGAAAVENIQQREGASNEQKSVAQQIFAAEGEAQDKAPAAPDTAAEGAPAGAPVQPAASGVAGQSDVPTGAQPTGPLTDLAKQWDLANRSSRATEWQTGEMLSNPAFHAVAQEGMSVPAHGMSKAKTLGEGLRNLLSILQNGIDPNRTLYYEKLTKVKGSAGDGSTGGGVAYRDGPFILTFREGLVGQPTNADIRGVLVNPAHAELVPHLQAMFPNLTVRSYDQVADVVSASRTTSQPTGPLIPGLPTGTDPKQAALAEIEKTLAESRARQEAAAQEWLAKEKADADAKRAAADKVAATGSNYQQKTAETAQPDGAVPVPNQAQTIIDTAKAVAAKNTDLADQKAYTTPVLYGIINHPDTGPELLNAARTELERRKGNPIAPNVSMSATQSLSPQAKALQAKMQKAQNATDGNTGTTSQGLDSQAQPGGQSAQRVDSAGRANPVAQAAGAADGQLATATKAGSGTPTGSVQLQLAPKADKDTILRNQMALKRQKGVVVQPVADDHPLTYEQKVVSHLAAKMGKTLTWVELSSGPDNEMPDGWINSFGGEHIFLDINSSKPLLEVLLHEGTHGLPSHIRVKLRAFVNSKVSPEGRAKFLAKYNYEKMDTSVGQDEEVLAYVAQQISRKPEFLSDLKTALGNKDFSAFVAHVLSKFKELMGGKGQSEFDSEFLGQHVKDVAEIHQRLVEAYTQAMQEQGLQPDQQLVGEEMAFAKKPADFNHPEERLSVSTAQPTAKPDRKTGYQPNSYDEKRVIDADDVLESKSHLETIGNALRKYNTLSGTGDSRALVKELHDVVVDNLLWLHDRVNPEVRERAKLWYDGANRIANEWKPIFSLSSDRQAGGILAVLSPQMDWFKNVSLAERALTILQRHGNETWSSGMTQWADSWLESSNTKAERESRAPQVEQMRRIAESGKTLSQLTPEDAAMFVRAFDEAYFPRSYRLVTPEGGFGDFVRNEGGKLADVTWGGFGSIAKAVRIYRDGSFRTVDRELGGEHKVRNFYNNIVDPNSADGHVTIDTHAVAAALLKSLSGNSEEVKHNLGGLGSTASTGASGSYAIFADAYRDAAAKRGLLAREMQSITWEAVRSLFPANVKDSMAKGISEIHDRVKAGEITKEQARAEIDRQSRAAGGSKPFAWEGSGFGEFAKDGATSFDGEISPDPDERQVRVKEAKDARDKMQVSISASTTNIPWIGRLYKMAQRGNEIAHAQLQILAVDGLKDALKGVSASFQYDPVTGLYGGASEPSLAVTVSFKDKDRDVVLAALKQFADNFKQEQIHVRQATRDQAGQKYQDGSYVTPVYRWELNRALDRKEVQKVIDKSGLYGLTFGDGFVEAYYVGDPEDASARKDFDSAIARADQLLGSATKGIGRKVARLWAYGDRGDGAIGWGRAGGDSAAGQETQLFANKSVDGAGASAQVDVTGGSEALPNAVSLTGIHFSQQVRNYLDGRYNGTGLKGAERNRLADAKDSRIKERVYFYVDEGNGIRPEAGVGGVAHAASLENLYNVTGDPQGLFKSRDDNANESALLDAGYSGYYVPKVFNNQGVAVVLGNSSRGIAVTPTGYEKGKAPEVAPTPYKRGLTSKELNAIDLNAVQAVAPSAKLRMGTLSMDQDDVPAARQELAKQGIDIPEAGPAFANKAQRNLDQDVALEIPVEGGGTAKLTVNAQQYINQLDKREEALRMVKECMA